MSFIDSKIVSIIMNQSVIEDNHNLEKKEEILNIQSVELKGSNSMLDDFIKIGLNFNYKNEQNKPKITDISQDLKNKNYLQELAAFENENLNYKIFELQEMLEKVKIIII